jgi:hypothetical protein
MIVPGLPTGVPAQLIYRYATPTLDRDLFVDLGSPTDPVDVLVYVISGVIMGSTDTGNPALDLTNLPTGSTVQLVNNGLIEGRGGDGGLSWREVSFGVSGGGGGGAGTLGGTGAIGTAAIPSTVGADGSSGSGGAGGTADNTGGSFREPTNGLPGGDAINAGSIPLTVINSGSIWGGGGGGGGGNRTDAFDERDGGAGGDSGQPGEQGQPIPGGFFPGKPGGAAGYAIRGTAVTVVSGGSSPNMEGTVG